MRVKARNASAAGAAAVIIYNNAANVNAAPPGMAGDRHQRRVRDGTDGQRQPPRRAWRSSAQLAAASRLTSAWISSIRAGADALDRAGSTRRSRSSGGSSISHYDTVAFRNLLMEPAINPDLTHNVKAPFDLTWELLHDDCTDSEFRSPFPHDSGVLRPHLR